MLLLSSKIFAISDKNLIKDIYTACKVIDKTIILNGQESKFVKSSLYSYFRVQCPNKVFNAYPVRNWVRIGEQKIIVIVNNKKQINNIILRSFVGGTPYRPTKNWYKKFKNTPLLNIDKIDGKTGATFTTKSTIEILKFIKNL